MRWKPKLAQAPIAFSLVALITLSGPAISPAIAAPSAPTAASKTADTDAPWPEAYIEIFKLAPGKQEAFIREIARADEVASAGGQPPIQVYFHVVGADWDILFIEPYPTTKPTAAQEAAMEAKRKEFNIPSGPAYFVHEREMVASHTDTKTYGPITSAQWLSKLDAWRAAHPATGNSNAKQ